MSKSRGPRNPNLSSEINENKENPRSNFIDGFSKVQGVCHSNRYTVNSLNHDQDEETPESKKYEVISSNYSLSLKVVTMITIMSRILQQLKINLKNVGGDKAYAINTKISERNHNQRLNNETRIMIKTPNLDMVIVILKNVGGD